MKKYIFILSLVCAAGAAFATLVSPFKDWNELVDRCPDIVIARYASTVLTVKGKPVMVLGGSTASDIEVISILKGNTRVGMSHMVSSYRLYPGQQFLLFGRYVDYQAFPAYQAAEDYQIVPLNRDFQTNMLAGKTLEQQVQWAVESRLHDLNDELARGNEEKKRLEEGLKIPSNTAP